MNEQAPYDSFYSRLTQASVWFYTNILRLGKYEDESIVNFVDAKENSNVLDYGCNTGRHARLVKQKYDCNVIGGDIHHAAVSATNKNGIPAEIINSEVFDRYKSFFDVIILSHVLEHVDIPSDFLKGILGLLKEGGSFVTAVPQERIRGDINPLQTAYFFSQVEV